MYPDDAGRRPHSIEDDGELVTLTPPNSQRTSEAASRPASRPITRSHSYESGSTISLDDTQYEVPPEASAPAHTTHSSREHPYTTSESSIELVTPPLASPTLRHRGPLPATRSFSNLDDAHFRGHRDSVTLARGRLVHSSPFSDIVKTHRDSVALAKKRMRERRAKMGIRSEGSGGAGEMGSEGSASGAGSGKHVKIAQ